MLQPHGALVQIAEIGMAEVGGIRDAGVMVLFGNSSQAGCVGRSRLTFEFDFVSTLVSHFSGNQLSTGPSDKTATDARTRAASSSSTPTPSKTGYCSGAEHIPPPHRGLGDRAPLELGGVSFLYLWASKSSRRHFAGVSLWTEEMAL